MSELKCPWQTVTTTVQKSSNQSERRVEFGSCLKAQCPFWHPKKEIGYMNTITEHCMRVKGDQQ